jgi:hypothetical protein
MQVYAFMVRVRKSIVQWLKPNDSSSKVQQFEVQRQYSIEDNQMQPPMISHLIHDYKTDNTDYLPVFTESAEIVVAANREAPLLLTTASKRDGLASEYILLLLLVLLSIAGYLVNTRLTKKTQQQTDPAMLQSSSTYTSASSPENHSLHLRLVQLLNGDENAAHRLLRHSYINHPNRSQQWHYEHVIDDILRDRR